MSFPRGKIPVSTTVLPSAHSLFYEGGEEAVLCIHGYSSYPGEMKSLADGLYGAGYTVSVPRLPGHGTNLEDFLSTGADEWLRASLDEYIRLRSLYKKVSVLGLSMGGIIAVLLADIFPTSKLGLLVPALLNREKAILLTPFLKFFIKKISRKGVYDVSRETDPDRIALGTAIWSYNWLSPGAELLKLQRRGRRAMSSLSGDCLVVTSEKDIRVPAEVADYIRRKSPGLRVEHLGLKESGHVVTFGKEQDLVAEKVVEWLKK